jgi:hypothetical protein
MRTAAPRGRLCYLPEETRDYLSSSLFPPLLLLLFPPELEPERLLEELPPDLPLLRFERPDCLRAIELKLN